MQPRVIRLNKAHAYLGISEPEFRELVRPYVTEVIHKRKVMFDRLDLDAWWEHFKEANGKKKQTEDRQWQNQARVLESVEKSGKLTKPSQGSKFERVLELRNSKKRKNT